MRFLPRLAFFKRPASSIVSYGSLHDYAPAENLALYALAFGLATVAAALLLRPDPDLPSPLPGDWSRPMRALAVVMLVAVAVNASWIDPAAPMTDPFHEGETLAFGPAVQSPAGLAGAMIIHGPGIDLLPDLLASRLSPGAEIATTRALRALEGLLFWAAFSWAIWELLAMGAPLPRWLRLAVLLSCSVILAATGFTPEMARKSVLALQFALLARSLRRGARAPLAAALGASVPVGFFYNYLEGIAGGMLIAVGAVLWWWRGERRATIVAAAGAAVASAGAAALAWPTWRSAFAQVAYWARDGQLIWGLPLRRNEPIVLLLLFGPLVAVHAAACVRLWRARVEAGSWKAAAIAQADLVLALAVSATCARSWIDRADDLHMKIAAWASLPLLLALARPALARVASVSWARPGAAALVAAVPLAGFLGLHAANPVLAFGRVLGAGSASSTPDEKVMPASYLSAAHLILAELRPADCFWTLTSEGIWYHLLGRPSCSRFHHVVYARAADAQAEVVADLERARPPVILFANEEWWNRVDGVPVAVTNRPLQEYALSRYRPWRHEGEHWLWKRAKAPLQRGAGCVPGAVARTEVTGAGVARVSGRVDGPGRVVYLMSSEGRPAAAGQSRPGGDWEIDAPAGEAVPARAFAYDPGRDALVPFCAGAEGKAGAEVQAERSHG